MGFSENSIPQHAMSLTWDFLNNILSTDDRFETLTISKFRETWDKSINLNEAPHWIFNSQFLVSILYTMCLVSSEKNN